MGGDLIRLSQNTAMIAPAARNPRAPVALERAMMTPASGAPNTLEAVTVELSSVIALR